MGTSFVEHADILMWLLSGSVALIISLIALVYRGLIIRIKLVEEKIPSDIVTMTELSKHCKEEQEQCPFNGKLEQIASDTKYLRESIEKIISKQEVLREQTLPEKYLKIVEYEKNHLRIELLLKENIATIKDVLDDRIDSIKLVIDKIVEDKKK